MKLKLLTIGILALLLCATVPMAAMAAPVKAPSTKIDGKLYQSTFSWDTMVYSLGKNIGKIVIDKQTKIYTITTSPSARFTPGQHDLMVAEDGPAPRHGRIIGSVMADANGNIIDSTGTIINWSIDDITLALANGGWFMVADQF